MRQTLSIFLHSVSVDIIHLYWIQSLSFKHLSSSIFVLHFCSAPKSKSHRITKRDWYFWQSVRTKQKKETLSSNKNAFIQSHSVENHTFFFCLAWGPVVPNSNDFDWIIAIHYLQFFMKFPSSNGSFLFVSFSCSVRAQLKQMDPFKRSAHLAWNGIKITYKPSIINSICTVIHFVYRPHSLTLILWHLFAFIFRWICSCNGPIFPIHFSIWVHFVQPK